MSQGLSKREKILLFSACLLVIFYLSIQFVILPLATRYVDGLDERRVVRSEAQAVRADIANRTAIMSENQAANERFDDIRSDYPELVPNDEVHNTLTHLCLMNGLNPTRLTIVSPPPSIIAANEGATPEQAEQAAIDGLFTIITASMQVNGNFDSLKKLLNAVDKEQYIRITNVGFAANRDNEGIENSTMTLNFELTYVNPPN